MYNLSTPGRTEYSGKFVFDVHVAYKWLLYLVLEHRGKQSKIIKITTLTTRTALGDSVHVIIICQVC